MPLWHIIIIIIIYSLKIGAGQQGRICGTYSCPQYNPKSFFTTFALMRRAQPEVSTQQMTSRMYT